MAWTRTGTVNLVNGSSVVTGAGTAFIANAMIGDGFRGPNGALYEVTNIATDTSLNIQPPYEGVTVNGASYFLAPIQGYNKDTAKALRTATLTIADLPLTKQDKNDNLTAFAGLTGAADRLPYFTGAGALSIAAITQKARALLARTDVAGMQAELELVKVSSNIDTTANRLMTVGYMGLGGLLPVLSTSGAVNALNKTGSYYVSSTGDTPESYGFLTHSSVSATDSCQEFVGITTGNTWRRVLFSGTWSTWKIMISSTELNLDPANGGAMSLTTVNGFTVVKFANGAMCMMGKLPDLAQVPANGSVNTTATIPSGFISVDSMFPVVIATGNVSIDHYGVGNYYIASPTSFNFGIKNGASPQAFLVRVVIWGRWK